jgi:hypothetical protein
MAAACLCRVFPLNLQTLPENTWTPLQNTAYQIGRSGFYEYRAWCNMKWDADSQRILFWEGLDTGTYSIYANALYSLDPAAETVRLLSYSSYWVGNGNQFTPGAPPETPHPRHCYGAFEYAQKRHALYMGFGACSGSSNCENTHIWKWDPASGAWTECAPVWTSYNYDQNFMHFRGSDTLWILGPNSGGWVSLYAFDLAAEALSPSLSYGMASFAAYDGMTAVDTLRQTALFSTSAGFYVFTPGTHSLARIAGAPAGISGGVAAIAYVQKQDLFFIHDWANASDWAYHPANQTWDSLQTVASPSDASGMGQNSRHRNIVYDPVADLLVIHGADGFKAIRLNPAAMGFRLLQPKAATSVSLVVSPNPVGSFGRILVSGSDRIGRLSVTGIDGRGVADLTAGARDGAVSWDTRSLPAGVYIVKLESASGTACRRVLVMQ